MSASVSQLKYWLGTTPNSNEKNTEGGEGGTYLSYKVFLGLSVLGGFFALDHLYLRSPLTFLAKFMINFMFFGIWWIYDAAHAIFSTETVKVFGLGVPGLGPRGIAGGVLSKDVPDKLHLRFFTYAMALIFGGMIGLDSFLLGDKQCGFIRLVCTISVIFAPVAFIWWVYKMFRFFTDTKGVVDDEYEFFAAPHTSLENKMTSKYPFLSYLFNPLSLFDMIFSRTVKPVIAPLMQVVETSTGAVRDTITGTAASVEKTTELVRNTVALGKASLDKGVELAGQISNTIDKTGKAVAAAQGAIPGVSLYSSITPDSLSAAKQAGGSADDSNLNVLPYALLGTLAIVAVSGFVTTYRRSKNNEPFRDDTPPEPGVLRKPDSKERSA